LPAGNYLFLRCSGDEAAAALSAVQFVAWLGTKVSRLFTFVTLPKRSYFVLTSTLCFVIALLAIVSAINAPLFPYNFRGAVFTLPLVITLLVMVSTIIAFLFPYMEEPVFTVFFGIMLLVIVSTIIAFLFPYNIKESVFTLFFVKPNILDNPSLFLRFLSLDSQDIGGTILSFLIFVCFLVLGLLLAFVIFVTQAIMCWAFGWTQLSTGLLVELAIEPLPFGAHSLIHIDWSEGPGKFEGIVHSWTYAHPAAIMHLQNWVRASLGNCPSQSP